MAFYKEIDDMNDKFDIEKWYDNNIDLYKSLATNVANTLKIALDKDNIAYVDIPYRVKSKQSLVDKWKSPNKKYTKIDEITDLAGVRVITLVESDLPKVENIIKELFNIHEKDSSDKNTLLGNDKVGYRSIHYVCDIGGKREKLYELEHLKGKTFEIQIRTALAHAWAEIEHDRCYKLKGKLPNEIERRLKLVAGLLESADNEFNRLTKEIEEYQIRISNQINNKQLDIEINSITLKELISDKYSNYISDKKDELDNEVYTDTLLYVLDRFKIKNIENLDSFIKKTINNNPEFPKTNITISNYDFIIYILSITNLEKTVSAIYEYIDENIVIDYESYNELLKYYPEDEINKILDKYDVEIN